MRVRINAQMAKKAALGAAGFSTSLATLSTVMPPGTLQTLFVGGAWVGGGIAALNGAVWLAKLQRARHMAVTSIKQAQESDLSRLHDIAVSYFGDKVTSLNRMKKWWNRNPTMFSTVTTVTRIGTRKILDLDGYFGVLPLAAHAAADIAAERKGINDLEANDICTVNESPAGVYIGAVVADGTAARSAAMQGLMTSLKRMTRGRRDLWVMARPVTVDGVRLVKAFGMEPMRVVEDPLGVLHRAKVSDLLPTNRRRQRSKKSV